MSLSPAKLNFTLWEGATFRKRLTFYSDSEGEVPVDLTGYTSELVIRTKPRGASLLTLDTENDGITLDDEGNIELFISDEDTAALDWDSGVYDLTLTDPDGDTDVLLWGSFIVKGI